MRPQLGAPGIYLSPPAPVFALTGERMDVCAFVGVAPRGPAWQPLTGQRSVAVPVESWSEYQQLYGAFEGPGLLPYAVASFFENGGRRAYVVRVVHDFGTADPGLARAELQGLATLSGPIALRARDPGSWGNRLQVTLTLAARPAVLDAAEISLKWVDLPRDSAIGPGTILRVGMEVGREIRLVTRVDREWEPDRGMALRRAVLDRPLPSPARAIEVVEGRLDVADGDERVGPGGRRERLEGIGLSSLHPRWLARVLAQESSLLAPDERPASAAWMESDVVVPVEMGSFGAAPFEGGEDHYPDIVPEDFFSDWIPSDERPGDGVHALVEVADVSLLCAPDLYSPAPLDEQEVVLQPISLAGAEFGKCVEIAPAPEQEPPAAGLDGLRLDPATELEEIAALQGRLVELADQQQQFIVLLDVPPGLSQRRILWWRAQFASAYVAAYHPWLVVQRREDLRDRAIHVPPSAVAAGIVAGREWALGLPHGPANVLAEGVLGVVDRVAPARHDELHQGGINVYLQERDGVRLTAARTLSLDPSWRQLSVRRLVTMLRRTLDRQMQWVVFEPNGRKLRADLTRALESFLRRLYRAGAFTGAKEAEAFFVRCDETLNTQRVIDQGQLLCEVGVAPSEPLEFIVLTIVREGDGTLRVGG